MRIGYDAKRIFHNSTGLGNYGRDVVRILNQQTSINHLFLFNTKIGKREHSIHGDKNTIIYPKTWFWKTFPFLWRMFGQWKQIRENNLDIYHGLTGEIPFSLFKQKTLKTVTIHDLIFLSHPQYYNIWDRIIYRLKFKYASKKVDRIIAISEHTKSDIMKFFKIEAKKITVVYQGCHNQFKHTLEKETKDQVKKKFRLPEAYILNVGTLQERKNALTLIQAIQGTSYHLVLVGQEKKYAKKLYDYVEKHNLHTQVTFIKDANLEELVAIYQSATMFCYPSICEGFGIPIIEALYSKIPVIVTKGGCFPESAGPDSIYIDPNDIDEIRKEISRLYENPQERKIIAEKGYAFVKRFCDENVSKNLMGVYESILQSG